MRIFADGIQKKLAGRSCCGERGRTPQHRPKTESLLFQHVFRKVVFGDLRDNTGEHQQGNQVGDRHETVQRVGNVPHQGAGAHGADDADQSEDDLVDEDEGLVVLCEVTPAVLTVVGPGEDRGKGEEEKTELDDFAAEGAGKNGVEGCRGRRTLGGVGGEAAFRVQNAGEQHGEGRDGADDNGVDEDLKHTPDSLLAGFLRRGSGMGNGGGAETGLIGEDAAGKALLHGHHDGIAEKTAADALEGEGARKNLSEDGRDVCDAHEDQNDAGDNVEDGHERNQQGSDLADALDAAEGDEGHDHGA